jgi:hypothetical protein
VPRSGVACGIGMRLMEGMRLRIKDVDFCRHAIIVREARPQDFFTVNETFVF